MARATCGEFIYVRVMAVEWTVIGYGVWVAYGIGDGW